MKALLIMECVLKYLLAHSQKCEGNLDFSVWYFNAANSKDLQTVLTSWEILAWQTTTLKLI